ncbi:phenylalanine--tRNA ligase subunit beta [Candidatus Cytomitobacter indipagum]|uniref:phenylalanine--tRNA ligase n=1 Tax=Candidatus Cytomitobacter indipagum TaxID=2601575 RepID=A0A5C0UD69_9PROT|nr:phenylalanine--tRNA ligase subunit beta [Candidatus Cytomitobacter indipagum]QEK37975.1 phenylalanine--tRNA ligase subunit beta [Candidatus Cytomitobacter indipagum]
MKFTTNWIKEFYDFKLDNLESRLIERGLEIESRKAKNSFENFAVAEILELSKHPNADKLNLCVVKTKNNEKYEIVCGASNLYLGMRVILARIGAKIPRDNFVLQKAKIRGIESCGMLCSADELNINNGDSDGILDITEYANIEDSVGDLFDDGDLFDIEVTANRKDVLNIAGIARETSAGFADSSDSKFELYKNKNSLKDSDLSKTPFDASQDIDYAQITMSRNTNKDSKNDQSNKTPFFILNRLSEIGAKITDSAMENIVNYVHYAFGYNFYVSDKDISEVKSEVKLEAKNTIDIFHESDKNISDLRVEIKDDINIGNENSDARDENSKNKNNINIYAISFNCEKSNLKYSYGDSSNLEIAVNYLSELLEKYLGYKFISGIKCIKQLNEHIIHLNFDQISDISGHEYAKNNVIKALQDFGFKIMQNDDDKISVDAPIWRRNDIKDPHCLIEEIIRYYGINNIPSKDLPFSKVTFSNNNDFDMRKFWTQRGLYEVLNNSFMDKKDSELFNHELVNVNNPMTSKQHSMRPSLLPGLLHMISKYLRYNWQCDGIFEIGKIFSKNAKKYESNSLGCVWINKLEDWKSKEKDFFDCKLEVENFLKMNNVRCDSQKNLYNGCEWIIQDKSICKLIEVDKNMMKHFKIKHKAFAFEINLDLAHRLNSENKDNAINEISMHNVIYKDLSFNIPQKVEISTIMNRIKSEFDQNITIKIFDIYPTKILSKDKSVGIRMIWENLEQTKTSEEIEGKCSELIKILEQLGCKYE